MKTLGLSILLALSLLMSVAISAAQEPGESPADSPLPERRHLPAEILEIVADATGLTPEEILTQAREDELTLAEIIENAGGDVAAVQAEITAAMTDAINERHDDALGNLDQRVDDLLNNPLPERGEGLRDRFENRRENRQEGRGLRLLVRAAADTLNITPREFMDAWAAEQSLADAITAQAGDVEAVKAAALETVQTRLDRGVENGRITAEQAAEMLSAATAELETLLSQPRPTLMD